MSKSETSWWKSNWPNIVRLGNSERTKIHNLLKTQGVYVAELYLWKKILDKEELSMHNGMKRLVYVGDAGQSLDALVYKGATIESAGNYGTVKLPFNKWSVEGRQHVERLSS